MHWLHPPKIKIYEALGSVADGRVEITGNTAKVWSSSRNKFYVVNYDPETQSVMVNDNASFYNDYLGYPAIAFLMLVGELAYTPTVTEMLKGIKWKDINQKFKNDYEETIEYILENKDPGNRRAIEDEIQKIEEQLRQKHYAMLGNKVPPPEGY